MEMNKCFYCGCELTEENISPVVLTSNPPKFMCKNCQSGTPSNNSDNKNIELFDSKYVHFMWSDELEGKKGFLADNIDMLKHDVNSGQCRYNVSKSEYESIPFHAESDWKFFYYDPNYECKRAYSEGKQIQTKYKTGDEWKDVSNPGWYDYQDYRIKPEELKPRRMTYRQLAEWLAKGNGQYKVRLDSTLAYIYLTYRCEDTCEVPEDYLIRHWNSSEWIEPTFEAYDSDVLHNIISRIHIKS
jgi:hypothetical protein